MTQISFSGAAYNMFDIGFYNITLTSFGSSIYQVSVDNSGTSFDYLMFSTQSDIDVLSDPIVGTIDSIIVAPASGGTNLASIVGSPMSLAGLTSNFNHNPGLTDIAFRDAFLSTVGLGTTTINFGTGSGVATGDFYTVASGTMQGANDIFSGSLVNAGSNSAIGDAAVVSAGAILNGGNDQFTNVSGFVFGDVGGVGGASVNGTINGGNDIFTYTSPVQTIFTSTSAHLDLLVGDVGNIGANGSVIGGDDTIDIVEFQNVLNILGDVDIANGVNLEGGNDTINLTRDPAAYSSAPPVSLIAGDANQVVSGSFTGGNDTIALVNRSASQIFGDVANMGGTGTFSGGSDTISLSYTVPYNSFIPPSPVNVTAIFGDFLGITSIGAIVCGNDTITSNGIFVSAIFGDGDSQVLGTPFQGGNDIISYTASFFPASSLTVYGDLNTGGTNAFTGGQDTITVTGSITSSGTFVLYGDMNTYSPAANTAIFAGGNDVIVFNSSNSENAVIVGDVSAVSGPIQSFTGGNDTLIGGQNNDQIFGDSNSSITASTVVGGADILDGRGGDDYIDGGGGTDTALFSSLAMAVLVNLNGIAGTGTPGNEVEAVGQGDDQLLNIENVIGSSLSDSIIGNGQNNRLDGANGSDWLDGNGGTDTLIGGGGNDVLDGGAGADILNGVSGYDIADYTTSSSGVTVNLFFNVGVGGDAQGDTYFSIENIWGSALADIVRGTATENILEGRNGSDQLLGDGGNDILRGGSGNDFLTGGAGADILEGGSNTDTADYSSSAARVVVNLFFGNALEGDAEGDTFNSIENVFGSAGNDIIRGSTASNVLRGGAGADTLTGDGGADYFQYNSAAFGNDLITDFIDATDFLDFRGSGLQAVNMVVQVSAGDTYVSFTTNPGHVIKLDNFVGTFNASDCLF